MLFWIREIVGWVLIGFALWVLALAISYSTNRQVVEAGVVGIVGLGVLRTGVLLMRVSTAARIATREFQVEKKSATPVANTSAPK